MADDMTDTSVADMKMCFVTTGATAPFTELIESVLSPSSVEALREAGYTHMLVQHGTAKHVFIDRANIARTHLASKQQARSLHILGIDFNPEGLKEQFQLVQKSRGLVISHAGMFHISNMCVVAHN